MHLSLSVKRLFLFFVPAIAVISLMCSSCGTTRPYVYMQGQFDTTVLSKIKVPEPIIQKGDLISIIVYSDNPDVTKIFNQTLITGALASTGNALGGEGVAQSVAGATPNSTGYLVDENGNIEFPVLGLLHIENLTRELLKKLLDSKLRGDSLLKNPYYNIRFLNNRFTMLGEISRPGIFTIPSEHINLFEALALAGDMTYYARRENVLIIREQNGQRQFARLDLTKPEIISSPYFYLQQNDIVYIEQNRQKSVVNDQLTTRNIGIATSIISVVAILYSILHK